MSSNAAPKCSFRVTFRLYLECSLGNASTPRGETTGEWTQVLGVGTKHFLWILWVGMYLHWQQVVAAGLNRGPEKHPVGNSSAPSHHRSPSGLDEGEPSETKWRSGVVDRLQQLIVILHCCV